VLDRYVFEPDGTRRLRTPDDPHVHDEGCETFDGEVRCGYVEGIPERAQWSATEPVEDE